MSYTIDDLAALDRAIAGGTLRVRHNGREITYRDMDDLLKARAHVVAVLNADLTPPRAQPRHQLADFSD